MFHFQWPWLILLLPLPMIIRKIFPDKTKPSPPEIYFPTLDRLKQAFSTYSVTPQKTDLVMNLLLSLIWASLILAIMQPEKIDQFRQVKNKGYDLMLAIDTSDSMRALDFSTSFQTISRLDVTKDVVGEFVRGRQGDRIGLVTFGQMAYLHVPLTLDTVSLNETLTHLVSGIAGNGTAIGDAIGIGVKALKERPAGSRVLILLTDGEDNASSIPPLEAAKLAKQYGIRIHTVGVGKKGLVPFPNGFGGYGMVEVPIDEELLKEIASLTGGHYFLATDKKVLESIYQKIDELEKTESDETLFFIREPFYYYPLGLGMILLLILSLYQLYPRPRPDLSDIGES